MPRRPQHETPDRPSARRLDARVAAPGVRADTRAFSARTASIPIVLVASADPVAAGLVQSLARPGANVTGMGYQIDELLAKNFELRTG